MFIISITYTKSIPEVDALMTPHRDYLKSYFDSGVFVLAGRKVPRSGGVILANSMDRAKIESIVQEDPFFTGDVASFEITEFVPSMMAEMFAGLLPAS
ncbi:YciI family protein [Undibacterium sp. RTI2.1]|uniref:YciI family protein n=1 Tax=unclassified Undibacterium TaxID=2630295 RepID=UPI002B23750D|nr:MULTISPECIES: YciI family protein [unclassified Undibacterium]MEB0030107.1 YciI family protein [Undibacterium sp. RTI2.1]MEB0116635.1 YciI family protein [Undibacterium sp. RTI2.2]